MCGTRSSFWKVWEFICTLLPMSQTGMNTDSCGETSGRVHPKAVMEHGDGSRGTGYVLCGTMLSSGTRDGQPECCWSCRVTGHPGDPQPRGVLLRAEGTLSIHLSVVYLAFITHLSIYHLREIQGHAWKDTYQIQPAGCAGNFFILHFLFYYFLQEVYRSLNGSNCKANNRVMTST